VYSYTRFRPYVLFYINDIDVLVLQYWGVRATYQSVMSSLYHICLCCPSAISVVSKVAREIVRGNYFLIKISNRLVTASVCVIHTNRDQRIAVVQSFRECLLVISLICVNLAVPSSPELGYNQECTAGAKSPASRDPSPTKQKNQQTM
jgi:hypothetical protein